MQVANRAIVTMALFFLDIEKENGMMSSDYIVRPSTERWYLKRINGVTTVERMVVSGYAPVNRLLKYAGYYGLETIVVRDRRYAYTYHKDEENTKKSEVMVMRLESIWFATMADDDMAYMEELGSQILLNHES